MALIKKINEIELPIITSILLYGNPGVGKTTIGASMPKSLIIDCDNGVHRARLTNDVGVVQVKSLKDINDLINDPAINDFESIVIDTIGKFVTLIINDLCNKAGKAQPTIKDWGTIKNTFTSYIERIKSKNKNIVFIAHEKETQEDRQNGIINIKRPDLGQGSGGQELIKDLDLIGYVRVVNNKVSLTFDPSEQFYAKNGYDINESIRKEYDNNYNYLAELVLPKIKEKNEAIRKSNTEYNEFMEYITNTINDLNNVDNVNDFYNELDKKQHIGNSLIKSKELLKNKVDILNLEFDKEVKQFKEKGKEGNNTEGGSVIW